jgi:hypothetical protein
MGGAQAAMKPVHVRTLLFSSVLVVLLATVGFAIQRELGSKPAPTSSTNAFTAGLGLGGALSAPALSAEEEAFATALWPIHSEVKLAAIRMIFAGLQYKTENTDAKLLVQKVQPLTGTFSAASERVRNLQPPASLADAHQSYLDALDLYVAATREMLRVAHDGSDEHLMVAQRKSEQASLNLIKLSDVLWPGEYKPN